jgi:radical SAM protein with 4Fe4S-binding SPASM domain
LKAKNISGGAPGGERRKLSEVLPLDTPFVVQIFPVYACNFKCGYCIFSVDKAKRYFISDRVIMDFDFYKRCIDDIAKFPNKVKVLRFVGIGEPLLHKHIVDMVKYAVEKRIAGVVEILTNAALLTPKMADELILAGLSRLVVSLQGTSKEKYQEISGVDIEFDSLVENLRYFFKHKGNTHMYFKIVDCALGGKQDEQKFYNIFGDICDTIAIEHAVPIHPGVNFEKILREKNNAVTQFGLPVREVGICPQPFFTMQINPDGKVVPCYSFEYPMIMGDCNKKSVCEIWNGKEFQYFRRKMLDGIKNMNEVCRNCKMIKYRLFPEDVINADDARRLKKFYESR